MLFPPGYRFGLHRGVLGCALAGLMAAGLAGCASSTSSSNVRVDTASASGAPDSDTHRRSRIRLELAAGYFERGQVEVAQDELAQSLSLDPRNPDAYNLQGLMLLSQGQFPQADDAFRRALALRPDDPDTLHNQGWSLCQQQKFAESQQSFDRALAVVRYQARARTWLAKGICAQRAGNLAEAETFLFKAYEIDAGNPVVGYNLSALLMQRDNLPRAQFYIRRLNNGEWANAESLWLGIKVERALGDNVAMRQLAVQLNKRFPDSKEWHRYERGAFHE